MITIEGTVRNIVFRNKSNCYTVARIDTKEQDIITVIGIFPSITTGEKYSFSGDWVVHKTYGRQFSVEAYEEILPTTKGGIEQYLSSFIKGIGPATAKKLVKHFGTEVFNVLENTPERLREIKGLKKIDKIISSYNEQREVKNIMTYLSGFNIPPGTAVKIYKTYGMACVEILKNNPYQLAEDIWGIGFKLSDRIAMKMGFAIDSPFRIASYITYQLQEATNHGHLFLERKNLVEMTVRDLGLSDDLVEKIISEMIEGKKVIIDDSAVYLKHLYHLEFNIARRLRLFKDISPLEAPEIEEIKTIQREVGVVLSSTQEMALNEAFSEGLLIITGGPGTGKTTTIRSIILRAEDLELSYSIGAPTGRAAKKLSETTGKTAMTIHRLLGYIPGENEFMHDEEDPLDADLVIVDEASMLDIYLFNSLLKGISPYARLILVGDVDQLPSVGPGNVLSDLI
ncbi:MAG TPA: helix-hairpin-helix domain-containing protein, partial [Candidatus Eremiobacteraeota bacterium]|nr:helix-hairpin-helix domain-containing protein [Candidatus Eremiobacteraeota bacterium]